MTIFSRWRRIAICTFACAFSFTALAFGRQADKSPSATERASTHTSSAVAPSPSPEATEELFARARKLSDLEAAGVPFHLKATFVASGDTEFTGEGTYEKWWRSKDQWRVDATLKDYRLVEIEQGGELKVWSTSSYVPLRLRQVLAAMRFPDPDEATEPHPAQCKTRWKKESRKISGLELIDLIRKHACPEKHEQPLWYVSQYLFNQNGVLRIYTEGAIVTLYNDFQPFETIKAPRNISVKQSVKPLSTSRSILLNPSKPVVQYQPKTHPSSKACSANMASSSALPTKRQ